MICGVLGGMVSRLPLMLHRVVGGMVSPHASSSAWWLVFPHPKWIG